MLIFSVVIFVFSTLTLWLSRPLCLEKWGVMTPQLLWERRPWGLQLPWRRFALSDCCCSELYQKTFYTNVSKIFYTDTQKKPRQLWQAVVSTSRSEFWFGKRHHQLQTYKSDVSIKLSLPLHFFLHYLLLYSSDKNDARCVSSLDIPLVVHKRAGCVGWFWK